LTDRNELQDLRARLDVLESKQAIVELRLKYCRAVDRGDLELLKSVFHADAVIDQDRAFAGNAHQFAELILPLLTRSYPHRHAITNLLIELDGERAFCETQYASSHRVAVDSNTVFDVEAQGWPHPTQSIPFTLDSRLHRPVPRIAGWRAASSTD
jgi:hypothetical protein